MGARHQVTSNVMESLPARVGFIALAAHGPTHPKRLITFGLVVTLGPFVICGTI